MTVSQPPIVGPIEGAKAADTPKSAKPIERFEGGRLRLFVKVAELKSFVRAAQELRLQTSLVSRRIVRLEASVGVQLLQRTTRNVSLTQDGERFYEEIRRSLEHLEQAVDSLLSTRMKPRGVVRVSSPVETGQYLVQKVLPGFFKAYPEIELEWDFFANERSPLDPGLDLLIRATQPEEKTVISRKIGTVRYSAYASPRLKNLLKQKMPVKDLDDLPWVLYSSDLFFETSRPTIRVSIAGRTHEIRPKKIVFRGNNMTAVKHMIIHGAGVGLLTPLVAQPELKQESLVPFMPEAEWGKEFDFYAIYPARQYLPPKVRVLVDWLERYFPYGPNPVTRA
ncbi:MAG: LysR family transcriptional regulator [Oligoflexia bacterium]|nr:LysR family transcriptional regulator [Oligoflexia bacterium]